MLESSQPRSSAFSPAAILTLLPIAARSKLLVNLPQSVILATTFLALGRSDLSAQNKPSVQTTLQSTGASSRQRPQGAILSPPANAVNSPDGRRCAWVSEDGKSVWSSTRTNSTAEWAKPDRLLTIRGVVRNITFSPDNKSIAFENLRNQIGLRQIGGLPPATWGFIVVYDLAKRQISYVDPSFAIDTAPVWSGDGSQISFTRKLGNLPELHLAKPVPRPRQSVWTPPPMRPSEHFTLASLMAAPIVYAPQISGDGRSIAYVSREATDRNIYFMRIGEPARRIANFAGDDGQELDELAVSKTGGAVAFVRGNVPNGQGDVPNPANSPDPPQQEVWIVGSKDDAPRFLGAGSDPQFTPEDQRIIWSAKEGVMGATVKWEAGRLLSVGSPEEYLAGQLQNIHFSPDGQRIAYQRNGGIEVYDLALRSAVVIPHTGATDEGPIWAPDSRHIAFLRQPLGSRQRGDRAAGTGDCDVYSYCKPAISDQPWSIWATDVSEPQPHQVWKADAGVGSVYYRLDQVYSPSQHGDQLFWSLDDRIAFVWEKDGWRHLYSVPVAGGSATLLTPGEGEVETAALSLDRKHLIYTNNIGDLDRRHLSTVAFDGTPAKSVTTGETSQWAPGPLADGKLAYIAGGWSEPPVVMVRDASGAAKAAGLPRVPASFPSAQLVKPELVKFPASDGQPSFGYLIVPPHPTGCAIVFSHGGIRRAMIPGFHYLDIYSYFYEMNEYLASRGCVVLSVDHRSGIMHGEAFRNAPGWGFAKNSEMFDFVGGAKYLLARKDVDASRGVGIYGLSWGGYVTSTALSQHSDIFKVGFDMAGVHAAIDDSRQKNSALGNIETWNSPVLLIQGDDDRNVSINDGIALAEAMRAKRPNVEFVDRVIPGETHDMYLTFRHLVELYSEGSEFLITHLGRR